MTLFRLSTLLSISGAVAAGAMLFWTSQSVQQAEDRRHGLENAIASEKQAIRVLHAEWDYLNRPDRLEALAVEKLGLTSAAAYNVSDEFSSLPDAFVPDVPESKPALEAQPIALGQPAPPPGMSVPVPRVKPAHETQSFNALLEELNHGEGKR